MTHQAAEMGVPRYFFSSSVCVYPDMKPGEPEMTEAQAVPANPDNEYGWEKLYSERMLQAYGRHYGMKVRIARFQNCYGPEGTWTGGREKAPAAICRKVAEVPDGGTIQVWGDGTAVRSYTYVDDMVDGIYRLMHSDLEGAANIGNPEYVTVNELVDIVTAGLRQEDQRRMGEGAGGRAVPQLQQRAHLLHRLARPCLDAGGDPAHVSVDRGTGAEGTDGEKVDGSSHLVQNGNVIHGVIWVAQSNRLVGRRLGWMEASGELNDQCAASNRNALDPGGGNVQFGDRHVAGADRVSGVENARSAYTYQQA